MEGWQPRRLRHPLSRAKERRGREGKTPRNLHQKIQRRLLPQRLLRGRSRTASDGLMVFGKREKSGGKEAHRGNREILPRRPGSQSQHYRRSSRCTETKMKTFGSPNPVRAVLTAAFLTLFTTVSGA